MPITPAAASAPPRAERVADLAAMRAWHSRPCSRSGRSPATSILRNMSIARVASISDRSCGVETITAPAGFHFWIRVIWTSPVPGGRSTISSSQSPQSPSIRLDERARRHRPAPGDRGAGLDQLADREHPDAVRGHRHDLLVDQLGPARHCP